MTAGSSVDKAESLIISGLFKGAAREAQRVLEYTDTNADDKLRAAYILLQALFELNRYPLTPHYTPPTFSFPIPTTFPHTATAGLLRPNY